MDGFANQLTAFKQTHRELDVAFHEYARDRGLSDSAFWMLYCIAEHGEGYTQAALCADWSFSPKTINSALKKLEERGLVRLCAIAGNRKNKRLAFTAAGRKLCAKAILPVMRAERDAFASLAANEREQLLCLTQKHVSLLRAFVRRIGGGEAAKEKERAE